LSSTTSLSDLIQQLGDPVVLLRAPFRLSFSYAGRDRIWKNSWHEADKLPAAIKLTVREAATARVLSVSTVAPLHVEAAATADDSTQQNSKDGSKDNSGPASAASAQDGSR
jgi:general secretion pathway protein J